MGILGYLDQGHISLDTCFFFLAPYGYPWPRTNFYNYFAARKFLDYTGGFPGGASGKESTCQCRRHKRCGLDHWVGKISWRRAQQPTPVFLPRESHGQRGLAGYSPWGHTELDMTEMTSWSPITESTRTLEMLASGLKIPEVFKFVIIFLPMSCLFVTIAETR